MDIMELYAIIRDWLNGMSFGIYGINVRPSMHEERSQSDSVQYDPWF
jgi:hypothetical protein